MKKRTKSILIAAAALAAVLAVLFFVWPGFLKPAADAGEGSAAQTASSDLVSGDYTYRLREDGTVMLTGYTGSEAEITLPEELEGKAVTALGMGAQPNSGTVRVTIPAGIVEAEGNLFRSWEHIAEIAVAEGHPTLTVEDGVLFTADHTLVCFPRMLRADEPADYEIPAGTERIGAYAFSGCRGILSLRIADTVTEIGSYAFAYCRFTMVTIPGSVAVIPDGAFTGCALLTRVNLSEGLTGIGSYAFQDCGRLTAVRWGAGPVENYATFPSSLRTIGAGAFMSSTGLTHVVIPEGVTAIGSGAFTGSPDRVPEVTLPASLTSLAADSFAFGSRFTVPAGSYAESFAAAHGWNVRTAE